MPGSGTGSGAGGSGGGATGSEASIPEERKVPLTIEAIDDCTITLKDPKYGLKYKRNDGEFQTVTESGSSRQATITVAAGDKISFFGNGIYNLQYVCFNINCSADCYVYGNVMSLLDSTNFKTALEIENAMTFSELFKNNTHIKNHPEKTLVLPATTLAEKCYSSMFFNCTGLTSAPTLPATDLSEGCYESMFQGCTGLRAAPALPAENLEKNCYHAMFSGCGQESHLRRNYGQHPCTRAGQAD